MVRILAAVGIAAVSLAVTLAAQRELPSWERANPIAPLPASPLGIDSKLTDLGEPPTPPRVRLGRWLFFDKRLSADGTNAGATCHRPEHAYSEPTPVSTGIRGQKGARKAPSFINQAWTLSPHFFWDGRAGSLEEQALGPVANPIGQHARGDGGDAETRGGVRAVLPRGVWHTRDHDSARRQGDRGLRAHQNEWQLSVGSLAEEPRRGRGLRRCEEGACAVLGEGRV